MPRTIKRYANRKLYDTSQSCYVTLDEIAGFVKSGEEVEIIDNKSKEDLTAVTLAQILFEAEKRKKRILPLATLRSLIQSGGELLEKTITRPVANIRQETEKRVTAAREVITKTEDDARERFNQVMLSTHKTVEDFQRRVDDRVRGMTAAIAQLQSPQGELGRMRRRVLALEEHVRRLEARLGMQEGVEPLLGPQEGITPRDSGSDTTVEPLHAVQDAPVDAERGRTGGSPPLETRLSPQDG